MRGFFMGKSCPRWRALACGLTPAPSSAIVEDTGEAAASARMGDPDSPVIDWAGNFEGSSFFVLQPSASVLMLTGSSVSVSLVKASCLREE